jgi:hypothetical protein
MKKIVLLFVFGFLCLTIIVAQKTNKKEIGAEIKLFTEEYNFGTIPEGPEVKFDFIFENCGTEPLVLSEVRASCGCTTPVWPKEPIMPGAKNKITAVYNTKGRPGMFTKTITVKSNALGGDKLVTIKGVVEKKVEKKLPLKAPNILNEMNN